MNKLNLEKNDEFLNLKKDKQLIYDELVNDTKQSILAEEKRALKYIDDIILPSIRKSNKIGITIRRFLVDDTMSNALSKVLVQQLQKLGFIAFLNKHTDTNKTYIYVTYSIIELPMTKVTGLRDASRQFKSTFSCFSGHSVIPERIVVLQDLLRSELRSRKDVGTGKPRCSNGFKIIYCI